MKVTRSIFNAVLGMAFALMLGLSFTAAAAMWEKPKATGGDYALQVEIIENQDGTLSMFYLSPAREVMVSNQVAPNSSDWTKKKSLDVYANQIKLGKHKDGRIELFAIGTMAGVVSHMTQVEAGSSEWTKEEYVDGIYATQIELGTNEDGSLVMVFIEPDKDVNIITQNEANGSDWSKKKDLDSVAIQIAVGNHADGRLEIFMIGTMANVMSRQTQIAPNGDDWSKEIDIKGQYGRQIEVGKNADGSLSLFYIRPDREIAYMKQLTPNGEDWSGGNVMDTYGNLIEVGNNSDGNIVLVIVGTVGNVLTSMMQTEGDNWSKETDVKGYGKQMRLGNNQDGSLELVYIAMLASEVFSTREMK
jgi:acylphosphatase